MQKKPDGAKRKHRDGIDVKYSSKQGSDDAFPFLSEMPSSELSSLTVTAEEREMTAAAVRKAIEMKKATGFDIMTHIRERRDFENPAVLEHAIAMFRIDCFGSNFDA